MQFLAEANERRVPGRESGLNAERESQFRTEAQRHGVLLDPSAVPSVPLSLRAKICGSGFLLRLDGGEDSVDGSAGDPAVDAAAVVADLELVPAHGLR